MTVKFGRCVKRYPSQSQFQPVVLDIIDDGHVFVGYDPEIGGAYPSAIVDGAMYRIGLGRINQEQARKFVRDNRSQLLTICNAFYSDNVKALVEELSYNAYTEFGI